MRIAFRVEGNKKIGLGHVMRCLSIANQLHKKKNSVIFIINDKSIEKLIKNKNFHVILINKKDELNIIKKILVNEEIQIIIFDSKKKTLKKIFEKIPLKVKIVIIDNIRYEKEADLLILPGIYYKNKKYPKNSISGFEHVLLNPTIKRIKKKREQNTILLSAGGSDKYGITKKIVKSFIKSNARFKIKIVLGKFFRDIDEIKLLIDKDKRFELYYEPKNFTEIMNMCSLGIITFGIIIYEVAYLRLPVLVIAHSKENHRSALAVEQYGWSKYLGKHNEIKYQNISKIVLKYLKDRKTLQKMSKAGEIIDGKGSKRVAEAIINLR